MLLIKQGLSTPERMCKQVLIVQEVTAVEWAVWRACHELVFLGKNSNCLVQKFENLIMLSGGGWGLKDYI